MGRMPPRKLSDEEINNCPCCKGLEAENARLRAALEEVRDVTGFALDRVRSNSEVRANYIATEALKGGE
jgi:hypothetical protein